MKISCQSCAAKYTIADEKVVGKVIKIKCKKCSSTIVVNGNDPAVLAQLGGDGGAGDDQATQLASRPPEPLPPNPDEWTVSVTDDDQRTMTTAQILAEYGAGGLSSDTYVWKDGMGDWLPLHQVPELAPLLAATGAAPSHGGYDAPPSHGGYDAPAAHGGYDAPPMSNPAPMAAAAAMPFGSNGTAASNAAKRASRASVDLFGGGLQEEVARPAAPMPPPGISDRHVGERNETSVLFSLKDLAAAENAAKAPSRSPFAESERVDDLLSLGSSGPAPMLAPPPMATPFVEPPPPPPPSVAPVSAAAAVAMAYQPPPQKKSPLPFILAGVGVAALLGAVALFVMSGKDDSKTAATSTAATDTKTTDTAKAKDTASETPTAKPTETSTATTATPEATTTETAVADADPKSPTTSTAKVASLEPSNTTKKDDPKPETTTPKEEPKTAEPVKGGDAPFDRGAASSAMNGAAGSAKGCKKADGPTGSAKVSVTFAPSGKATQATVGAPFAGTSVGSCIAGAFKGLSIPPFSGAAVTVSKTVNIK